jgi:SAM-dependent methyltransferase
MVFVDYRPLQAQISGLRVIGGDIKRLPFADGSVRSLSSLHVIEHIGLGRYGDPIDPLAYSVALRELDRVLAPGGYLYLTTPVGRERVCFNAHRVFAPRTILQTLSDLKLDSFDLVDDSGAFTGAVDLARAEQLDYGCGMFAFVKARPVRAGGT